MEVDDRCHWVALLFGVSSIHHLLLLSLHNLLLDILNILVHILFSRRLLNLSRNQRLLFLCFGRNRLGSMRLGFEYSHLVVGQPEVRLAVLGRSRDLLDHTLLVQQQIQEVKV